MSISSAYRALRARCARSASSGRTWPQRKSLPRGVGGLFFYRPRPQGAPKRTFFGTKFGDQFWDQIWGPCGQEIWPLFWQKFWPPVGHRGEPLPSLISFTNPPPGSQFWTQFSATFFQEISGRFLQKIGPHFWPTFRPPPGQESRKADFVTPVLGPASREFEIDRIRNRILTKKSARTWPSQPGGRNW